jgi:CD80-like C2-set immunoglobulin domain
LNFSSTVRPLTIVLDKDIKYLSTNHSYELRCEVTGARPTPSISWWKGSTQLRNTKEWVRKSAEKKFPIFLIHFSFSISASSDFLRWQPNEINFDLSARVRWSRKISLVPRWASSHTWEWNRRWIQIRYSSWVLSVLFENSVGIFLLSFSTKLWTYKLILIPFGENGTFC